MDKLFTLPAAILAVVALLKAVGARTLIMGGAIADMLTGREPKDWDLECHGATEEAVLSALADYRPKKVGASHAAIRFNVDGVPIDVSVPDHDANEAARRRDLTINSVYYDPETRELFDPFGGVRDGRQGILCATSEWFSKYPVNALRVAQFLSRGKGTHVDSATMTMALVMDPATIPPEQVFAHMRKLLSGTRPSKGLEWLRLIGYADKLLPELVALSGLKENPEWHPEGDSWTHTLLVLDAMAYCLNILPGQFPTTESTQIPAEWREALLWAALCHDLGKALTDDGTGSFKGHDQAGEAPTRSLLERLKAPKDLTEKVLALVTNHMQPWTLTWGKAGASAWRRLHNKVPLQVIVWLSRADWSAHPSHEVGDWGNHEPSKAITEALANLPPDKIPAIVQGRDLIAAGVKPGPHMKVGLDAAYAKQIEDPATDKAKLVEIALLVISQS